MLLEKINSPSDLKKLSIDELEPLAEEIRSMIIDTTTKNGGHLASSLGAVDFTIALYYAFDMPQDKVVWDVGHQSYAHKILTGRRQEFSSLRTMGGISGFPNRDESEYDSFTVGHSSTAISSALGIAAANYLKNVQGKVIAVVGDGSMTGGLTFEGLQNAGHLGRDLLVILNDNEMFISHKVGAFAGYLAKLLTAARVKRFEDRVEKFFKRIHFWGSQILRVAKRFKVLLFPGMLFEELGFSYLGPVDGHDIRRLVEILINIKKMKGPILLHLVTKKGKGYPPAESDPTKFHGMSPVSAAQKDDTSTLSFTQVFSNTLVRLGAEDKKIVAVTAAMAEGTGLCEFAREYPDRFFDVGIAEQHAVTFAAGLAVSGMKPICAIYSTFLQRSFDQLIHDVALNNLPVILAIDRGGIVGEDGATHHGVFDISYMRMIPNFVVCAPKDENEFSDILYSAFLWNRPVSIRYPRGASGMVSELKKNFAKIECGTSELLKTGGEVLIIALGNCVKTALSASNSLESRGISAAVLNLRFVKPLDTKTLDEYFSSDIPIVTLEENMVFCGMGSAINEHAAGRALKRYNHKILNIGLPDYFLAHGSQSELRRKVGIDAESVAEKIFKWLKS